MFPLGNAFPVTEVLALISDKRKRCTKKRREENGLQKWNYLLDMLMYNLRFQNLFWIYFSKKKKLIFKEKEQWYCMKKGISRFCTHQQLGRDMLHLLEQAWSQGLVRNANVPQTKLRAEIIFYIISETFIYLNLFACTSSPYDKSKR